jgi:LPS-assembly lipoprotein
MLSSDHGRLGGRRLTAGRLLAFATIAGLAACTVQPVYGPGPSGTPGAQAVLSHIAVDPVGADRVGQVVRNKLMFALTGGGAGSEPKYAMHLTTTISEVALGLNSIDSAPAYAVTVTVTYEVTRIGTNDILIRSTSHGTAYYDRVNQAFANSRAEIDAQDRAAAFAVADIRIRLAAAAARLTT